MDSYFSNNHLHGFTTYVHVVYSGIIMREKLFANFTVFFLLLINESFLTKYLKAWWTVSDTSKQSTKVFSAKSYFPTNSRKFSSSKDSLSTVLLLKSEVTTYISSLTSTLVFCSLGLMSAGTR